MDKLPASDQLAFRSLTEQPSETAAEIAERNGLGLNTVRHPGGKNVDLRQWSDELAKERAALHSGDGPAPPKKWPYV